jgi:Dyp-type peroxidase family
MEHLIFSITWFLTKPWAIPAILASIVLVASIWVGLIFVRNTVTSRFLSIKGLKEEFIFQNEHIFKDLQGNILKPHGRDHVALLFIHFTDVSAAKKSLCQLPVTSFYEQLKQTENYRQARLNNPSHAGVFFCNVMFSGAGYMRLGAADSQTPSSEKFRHGMSSRKKVLNDPPKEEWEEEFRGTDENEIHAMVLFAHDDLTKLTSKVKEFQNNPGLKTVTVQYGHRLTETRTITYSDGVTKEIVVDKEPFGFVDGISQPLFLESQITQARKQELGGLDKWDPSAPLKIVLKPDPAGKEGQSYGSYLVFRKLEQNVEGFSKAVRKLAQTLGISEDFAFAQTVGRFKDGTPLALTGTAHPEFAQPINNFNYQHDFHGLKCPLHAHIRKTNPRGSVPFLPNEIRIARRGIPYSETRGSENKVGLLFMSFQATLKQFEVIQEMWSNSNRFPPFHCRSAGQDPIIGQAQNQKNGQYWVTQWGQDTKKQVDFAKYVHFKGGEYFFLPSITGIRVLCGASDALDQKKHITKESETEVDEIQQTETTANETKAETSPQRPQKSKRTSKTKSSPKQVPTTSSKTKPKSKK